MRLKERWQRWEREHLHHDWKSRVLWSLVQGVCIGLAVYLLVSSTWKGR